MKKFILLIIILPLFLGLFADGLVIGTETSTQRYPLGAYYGYERSAALYTASEIGPYNIRISDISWYSETETYVGVPTKIYLKTTTDDYMYPDIWDYMISGATLLYDEEHYGFSEGDWNMFSLYSAFDVDQGSNLIVLVERNYGDSGGDSYEGAGIRYSYSPDNHITWENDYDPPYEEGYLNSERPNVLLSYTNYAITEPPNSAIVYSPGNFATNVALNAYLYWVTGGGSPTGYRLYFGTDNPPTNLVNNLDLGNVSIYYPSGMAFNTSYYWKIIPYNAIGDATVNLVRRFTTRAAPTTLSPPWVENFGTSSTFPPLDWLQLSGLYGSGNPVEVNSGWMLDDFCNVEAVPKNNSARLNIFGEFNARHWLVTPPVAIPAAGHSLKFDLSLTKYSGANVPVTPGTQGDDKFIVLIDDNQMMSSPTILRQWDNAGSAFVYDEISAYGESVNLDLSAYTGTVYIAFYGESTVNGGDNKVFVDNVEISLALNHDAKPVAINIPNVVDLAPFQPKATVKNNGLTTAGFSVTMTIGSYSNNQSVTSLLPGASQLVTFASYMPILNVVQPVTVTTNLIGDENTGNNELSSVLICLDLDVQAYMDVVYDPVTDSYPGPASFNLADPGTFTDLPAEDPLGDDSFLSGADWMNGGWYGAQYNRDGASPYWNLDHITGAGTLLGASGFNLAGIAYDETHDIIYGVGNNADSYENSLYTLSPTGVPTLLGLLTWDGETFIGLFLGLAHDNLNNILYGLDSISDAVFTIDPVTLVCTPLGYGVGLNLNFGQDMAFDQNTGMLYVSAYDGSGKLLWVNTLLPDEDGKMGQCYPIGNFQNGSQVAGFAIPHANATPIPNLSIAANGTLSWNNLGASSYKIYGSDNPYTGFTLLTTVSGTSWLDPNFPQSKKFYYVTASVPDARSGANRVTLSGGQNLQKGEPVVRNTKGLRASEVNSGRFIPTIK
ncbi:MAG: hypothetical protein LHW41_08945 [Candidatus Cloacimonetes bacterium]|nr:hypothetical protein [Candidatus Cloacimonadota bacterium]